MFGVIFIGIAYLYDWLNRKYTIRLQVFNWDPTSEWNVNGQYLSNAKIAGDDGSGRRIEFCNTKDGRSRRCYYPTGV